MQKQSICEKTGGGGHRRKILLGNASTEIFSTGGSWRSLHEEQLKYCTVDKSSMWGSGFLRKPQEKFLNHWLTHVPSQRGFSEIFRGSCILHLTERRR